MDVIRQKLAPYFHKSNIYKDLQKFQVDDNNLSLYFPNFNVTITHIGNGCIEIIFRNYENMVVHKTISSIYNRNSNNVVASMYQYSDSINTIILEFTKMRRFNIIKLFDFFKLVKQKEEADYDYIVNGFANMGLSNSLMDKLNFMSLD